MEAAPGIVSRHKNNHRRMRFLHSFGSKGRIPYTLNRLSLHLSLARGSQFLNPSLAKGMGLCGPNRSNSRDGSPSPEIHGYMRRNGNLANSGFT